MLCRDSQGMFEYAAKSNNASGNREARSTVVLEMSNAAVIRFLIPVMRIILTRVPV